MTEIKELCNAPGGSLDPEARCKFEKGHTENYHSSDGFRNTDPEARGYYWHDNLCPNPIVFKAASASSSSEPVKVAVPPSFSARDALLQVLRIPEGCSESLHIEADRKLVEWIGTFDKEVADAIVTARRVQDWWYS